MTHKKHYLIDLEAGDFFIVGSRTCIVLCTHIVSYGVEQYVELIVFDYDVRGRAVKSMIENWTFTVFDAKHTKLSKKERRLNE